MTEQEKKELVRRCLINNESIWIVVNNMVGRGADIAYLDVLRFFDKVLDNPTLKAMYAPDKRHCYFPAFYFAYPPQNSRKEPYEVHRYSPPTFTEVKHEGGHSAPSLKLELSFSELLNLYIQKR